MIGKEKVVTVQYPDRYKKLLLQNRRRDSVIYIETKNRSNYEGTEQLRMYYERRGGEDRWTNNFRFLHGRNGRS